MSILAGYEAIRSIPTGVGKTQPARDTETPQEVHPHGCGENSAGCSDVYDAYGPSPRVWGKPVNTEEPKMSVRSIPTGVGKTLAMHLFAAT